MKKVQSSSIDKVVVSDKSSMSFYTGCARALFKACAPTFNTSDQNYIDGRLRNGDLSVCQHDLVASKLSEARRLGNMSTKDFQSLYQFYSFTNKLTFSGDAALCERNGMAKLLNGEKKCLVTNMTIDSRVGSNHRLFDRVKRIINDIIGSVPVDLFTKPDIQFGPGSTVNVNNRSYEQTSAFYKLTDKLVVPDRAKYYLAAHVSSQPNWVEMLATHYHIQRDGD